MVQVDWSTMEVDSHSQNLSIYPNPAEDKVIIESKGISQVRIFNMMGQEVLNRVVDQNRVVIDLASQPSGFYFIEVVSEQGLETSKLLKK